MWEVGTIPNNQTTRKKILQQSIGEHRFISPQLRLLLKMYPDVQLPCQTFVIYAPSRTNYWGTALTRYQ